MPDSTSISTLILLTLAAALLLALVLHPKSLIRWLQRKRYQYEVTFSLYMLTPTEKFIFNSLLFLLLSLFIIAASLYLPEHVLIIARRIAYYFSGDESVVVGKEERAVFTEAATSLFGDALKGPGRAYMEP